MSYRRYYGDPVSVVRYARSEQFSTEHEALQRARELLEEDCAARRWRSTTPPGTASAASRCS